MKLRSVSSNLKLNIRIDNIKLLVFAASYSRKSINKQLSIYAAKSAQEQINHLVSVHPETLHPFASKGFVGNGNYHIEIVTV